MTGNLPKQTLLENRRIQFLVLAATWLAVQVLSFKTFGIVTNFEATKYIEQAQLLLSTNAYASGNFIFYSTEILLIAVCLKIGIGFWLVIVFQLTLNACATYYFHKLVHHLTKNQCVSFLTTLMLICMFYYQSYNVHLFTESLFFSFSILFSYLLFTAEKVNLRFAICVLGGLILLALTRPTGILFLPATIFFLSFRFARKKAILLVFLTIILGLAGFYFLLNAALDSGGEFDFLLPYIEEHIICGVPTARQPNNLNMPVNKNSVEALWHIVTHNSGLFFRLAKVRFLAFWGVQRSFFSSGHNLFVAAYFYPLYLFVLAGISKMFQNHLPQSLFMVTYILLVMLTVLLSCDEWHNRFIYSIFPFLLLIATGLWTKRNA